MTTRVEKTRWGTPLADAAYALRVAVFCDEQGVPPAVERDAYDETALHFVASEGGRVVGTLRVVTLDERTAKIGRVAVAKPCREKGIGKQLMLAALEQLKRDAFAAAVLTAQVQVIGFYEKLGFVAEGPVFDEAGIPHRKMTRVL
jgi:ElaA protein